MFLFSPCVLRSVPWRRRSLPEVLVSYGGSFCSFRGPEKGGRMGERRGTSLEEMMAEEKEGEEEQEQPSSPSNRSRARDLLRQFSGLLPVEESEGAAESGITGKDSAKIEIELSLGLSLGGCFGADPAPKRPGLIRSSSIAALPFLQSGEREPPAGPVLARTCSLPVEAEEEQRKRRKLQTLRRMEAKKKRSEKRNNFRSGCKECSAGATEESRGQAPVQVDGEGDAGCSKNGERLKSVSQIPYPDSTWGFLSPMAVHQRSLWSSGSSSGVTEFRPLIRQGSRAPKSRDGGESRSQSGVQPLQDPADMKAAINPPSPVAGRPSSCTQMEVEEPAKNVAAPAGGEAGMRDMMDEMPFVSTRGGGPGGRKVEGFLYRYGKGEDVRIVCVCHGSFFSPAEFVKHAGGGDVAHPLRHIVVNPSPSGFP